MKKNSCRELHPDDCTPECVEPSRVSRPWGSYAVLAEGDGFKVKRIDVNPGAALSLQLHRQRSEHWVVVSGTAEVVNGERTLRLGPGEHTFIPLGHRHRLSNAGTTVSSLIEVQCGPYLGEDDIERFADLYGRTPQQK